MTTHRLTAAAVHYEWDRALPPRLTISAGDTVVFETRDAADGFYRPTSTSEDIGRRGTFRGHPLTGPVRMREAEPGDVLVVEVLDVRPRAGHGYTAVIPGLGLLPREEFPHPYLQIWDLADGQRARAVPGLAVPLEPFPGILGTALDEPGAHSTMPPRKNGGNMDVKQMTAGTTVYLPVWVPGALFSAGDGHGAQGDGEVCVTAVEMAAEMTLRFGLERGRPLAEPQFRTAGPRPGATAGPAYATTAHGPDLLACARQAVRYMIDHCVRERGLSREQAYALASVAVDLRISEIVDAPNWIVSAFLPEGVFTAG